MQDILSRTKGILPQDLLSVLQTLAQRKQHAQEAECTGHSTPSRKRKRQDGDASRRVARRIVDEASAGDDQNGNTFDEFMKLPSESELADCYKAFYNATSNAAVEMAICAVDLPCTSRLVPRVPHPAHDLYEGKLLQPKHSLANGLWIGKVPWQLQVLTIPEQMLIALLYPQVFVFKLYPKNMGGGRNADTLQRAMRGNVSTYELDVEGIASMVQGKLLPRLPEILASVISVTFIGLGELPRQWLRSTFRVRCHVVHEALCWLKTHNPKY